MPSDSEKCLVGTYSQNTSFLVKFGIFLLYTSNNVVKLLMLHFISSAHKAHTYLNKLATESRRFA